MFETQSNRGARMRSSWGSGPMLVPTSARYADGKLVDLRLTRVGDEFHLDDGGRTVARVLERHPDLATEPPGCPVEPGRYEVELVDGALGLVVEMDVPLQDQADDLAAACVRLDATLEAEYERQSDADCPDCGGVGGGPDEALRCPYCRGSGLRHPRPRWLPDLEDPAVRCSP